MNWIKSNPFKRAGKAEWAYALAGGLSVWGVSGSLGQRPNVPVAEVDVS